MNFVRFNEDGRILSSGSCQACDFFKQSNNGTFVLEGEGGDETHYVDIYTREIKERPDHGVDVSAEEIIADGIDKAIFSFPETGVVLDIFGPLEERRLVNGLEEAFTATEPGLYTITIEAFPRKKETFSIIAKSAGQL